MTRQAFPVMTCDLAVSSSAAERAVSMDGIDTTPLASGAFAIVTTGPLAGRLYRLNKTSAAAPDGITIVAPVLGDGRWLEFPGAGGGVVASTEQMMRPEHLIVTGTANKQAEANYIGASFFCERAITFTAIAIFVVATGPTAINRFLIYQNPNGLVGGPAPLIAECSGLNTPTGRRKIDAADGPRFLERGVYWVIWGIDNQGTAGNTAINAATTTALPLFNGNGVIAGDHPSTFRTTLPATTVPDTFDPAEGGASGVTATNDLVMPIFRLVTP